MGADQRQLSMRLARCCAVLGVSFGVVLAAAGYLAPGDPGHAARPVPPVTPGAAPLARTSLPARGQAALVADRAFQGLMHAYLLERSDAARADALRLHLQQTLAPADYLLAAALVERYLAYMAAHDALLAVHKPASGDLRRMAIWCDQRDRLRQRMLGSGVTQAWYGQEDAQLQRIFAHAAQTHDLLDQSALDKAVQSFADLGREGPSWALRHAAYLEAKSRIAGTAGLDEDERSMRIRELLLRSFSSDAERYRARLLEDG
jgi:lipase chaperone LimK